MEWVGGWWWWWGWHTMTMWWRCRATTTNQHYIIIMSSPAPTHSLPTPPSLTHLARTLTSITYHHHPYTHSLPHIHTHLTCNFRNANLSIERRRNVKRCTASRGLHALQKRLSLEKILCSLINIYETRVVYLCYTLLDSIRRHELCCHLRWSCALKWGWSSAQI